jgi:hypothetical protein
VKTAAKKDATAAAPQPLLRRLDVLELVLLALLLLGHPQLLELDPAAPLAPSVSFLHKNRRDIGESQPQQAAIMTTLSIS